MALEQSPFLKVFPDARVRETLRLMQLDANARVTRTIAREIAQREQLKALVAGSIASLGSNYVLALEAINAASGDVMAREQIEVRAQGRRAGGAREGGEEPARASSANRSHRSQRFDVALPRATTGVARGAARLFAGVRPGTRGRLRLEVIPHLERAIALDPSFAMAYARLSGVYANNGRSAEAPTVLARRRSSCAIVSASASGSSFPGATTSMRSRRGTRRSTWRTRGPRPTRARRSPSTAWAWPRRPSASTTRRCARSARRFASIRNSFRRTATSPAR